MKKIYLLILLLPVMTGMCFLPCFAEKKPLSIRVILGAPGNFTNADTIRYTLAYDTSGHVDSMVYIHPDRTLGRSSISMDTIFYKFHWQPEKLEVSEVKQNSTTKFIYGLDAQGKAVSLYSDSEYSDTVRYEYDNAGRLVKQTMYYQQSGERSTIFAYNSIGNMTWAYGMQANYLPEEYDNYETTIRYYTNKANLGSLHLPLAELIRVDLNPAMCLASLAGKAPTHLPLTVKRVLEKYGQTYTYEREYFYTLNDDGYPTHIEELITSNAYQADKYCYLDITWTETKGVGTIAADEVAIEVSGREVRAEGVLSAYDMQGRLVASSRSGMLTLPSAGIYLLRCGNQSRKVAVQ